MLIQHNNYGFNAPVALIYMGRSKAQCEGNAHPLVEYWNAVAGHHRSAPWVSLSTPTDCVACMDVGEGREQDAVSFAPLDKELAITCEVRLAVNVDKLIEPAIIMLKEH